MMPALRSVRKQRRRRAPQLPLLPQSVAVRRARSAAPGGGSRRRGRPAGSDSSMPCVTSKRDSSGSGVPLDQPLEGPLVPVHVALLRRLLHHDLLALPPSSRRAAGSRSRARAPAPRRSRDRRSPCARRARRSAGSRARSRMAVFSPSNLQSWVNSTVRIGMLTPTPSVSVPLTTLSSPCCASFSTSSRYFGRRPAWCRPMPWRRKR